MPADPSEWAAPPPSTTGDRWRAIAPALALVLVALVGVRNHVDHDQSSWEGASFGLFATYDNDASRLALLVNSNDDPIVMVGVAVVCLVALPRPALL